MRAYGVRLFSYTWLPHVESRELTPSFFVQGWIWMAEWTIFFSSFFFFAANHASPCSI
jgi:hypothetical protein